MTILIILAAAIAVALATFYLVPGVRARFRDSETLLFARLQAAGGVVLGALEILGTIDPVLAAPFVGEKWLPLWLLGSGLLTEILRRARAEDL